MRRAGPRRFAPRASAPHGRCCSLLGAWQCPGSVTHVPGQICYPCARLHGSATRPRRPRTCSTCSRRRPTKAMSFSSPRFPGMSSPMDSSRSRARTSIRHGCHSWAATHKRKSAGLGGIQDVASDGTALAGDDDAYRIAVWLDLDYMDCPTAHARNTVAGNRLSQLRLFNAGIHTRVLDTVRGAFSDEASTYCHSLLVSSMFAGQHRSIQKCLCANRRTLRGQTKADLRSNSA